MKTILWCLITTFIGAFAAQQSGVFGPHCLWWGSTMGLCLGAIFSSLPILPESWQSWLEQHVLWRPNREFWHEVRSVITDLLVIELYLALLFTVLVCTLCWSTWPRLDLANSTVLSTFFLVCALAAASTILAASVLPLITLAYIIAGCCHRTNAADWMRTEVRIGMTEMAQHLRRKILLYNPLSLPFTGMYFSARAMRIVR